MDSKRPSRRSFLCAALTAAFASGSLIGWPSTLRASMHMESVTHPEPRDGIDASLVKSRSQLRGWGGEIQRIYDMVREMPHIADGVGCSCPCVALPTYRSLLTCFYEEGMAMGCAICQGEAKLVHRRFKEGQTLAQIRQAVDARFG